MSNAIHWLVLAEAHCLPKLAERAEEFILRADGNLSECPESRLVSPDSLLRLLDARKTVLKRHNMRYNWANALQRLHAFE